MSDTESEPGEQEPSFVLGDGPILMAPEAQGLVAIPHVHGPGCNHDHDDHEHHHHEERPHGTRPHGDHKHACQLDLEFLLPGEEDELGRFAELEKRLEGRRGILDVHRSTDGAHPELCVHYDPTKATLAQVLEEVRSTGAKVRERYLVGEWFVDGMDAPQAARTLEVALAREPGVLQANVAYAARRVIVEYDRKRIEPKRIVQRAGKLGFHLDPIEQAACCVHHVHAGSMGAKLQLPLMIASGVFIAAGFAIEKLAPLPPLVPTILYALALASGGFFALRGAIKSVSQFRFDIETLMVLSGAGAALLGAWLEGAFLLFLFSLGHALEHRAMDRARNALSALGKLRPEKARVMKGGDFVEVDVGTVQRGDRVLVRPGDRVPLDGLVQSGQSSVDQSAVTGESMPVAKASGDEVFAGTLNTDGALEIEVTKRSSESVISRVVDMVAQAEARKSPTQRFTQTIEERFVPLVLLAAVVFPIVLVVTGTPLRDAVLRAVSLLVAASPCALAISVPAAVLSAVATAARHGILIKGGVHLEDLGRATVIAFDKTGTLTHGRPQLVSIATVGGTDETLLLSVAASAEALSSHPLAQAILRAAAERKIEIEEATELKAVHGQGLRATKGEHQIAIGNAAMFEALPDEVKAHVDKMHAAGETTMIVQRDGVFLGVLGVADTLRDEARDVIAQLKALGVHKTMLLTGDDARVAKAIAERVGIQEVHGPLMPDQKVETMKRLSAGEVVAMIGDGVNDAPALAAASVGIAMGGAGADVALETADIVLMSDRLTHLPLAVSLARRASRVIRQNLVISLGVAALLIVAVVAGWAHIGEAIVLHEGSTILVALNGLRLLRA